MYTYLNMNKHKKLNLLDQSLPTENADQRIGIFAQPQPPSLNNINNYDIDSTSSSSSSSSSSPLYNILVVGDSNAVVFDWGNTIDPLKVTYDVTWFVGASAYGLRDGSSLIKPSSSSSSSLKHEGSSPSSRSGAFDTLVHLNTSRYDKV
jgi:hypothetical protein